MFVFMFCALTIGQLAVEQQMVTAVCEIQAKVPVWKSRKPFSECHANFVIVNLGFSLLLSLVLAMMFPAAGMIVLTSGLVSTMLSRPTAKAIATYKAAKVKVAEAKVRVEHISATAHKIGHKAWVGTHPVKAAKQAWGPNS